MEELKREVKQQLGNKAHATGRREQYLDYGPRKIFSASDPKHPEKSRPVQASDERKAERKPKNVSARQWKKQQKAERRRRVESWQKFHKEQAELQQQKKQQAQDQHETAKTSQ